MRILQIYGKILHPYYKKCIERVKKNVVAIYYFILSADLCTWPRMWTEVIQSENNPEKKFEWLELVEEECIGIL